MTAYEISFMQNFTYINVRCHKMHTEIVRNLLYIILFNFTEVNKEIITTAKQTSFKDNSWVSWCDIT